MATRNYTIIVINKDGTHVVESSGFCHLFTDVRLTIYESIAPNDTDKKIDRIVVVGPDGVTVDFLINRHGTPVSYNASGNRQVQEWYREERIASVDLPS